MYKKNKDFEKFYSEVHKYVQGIHFLRTGIEPVEIDNFENKYGMYLPLNFKKWLSSSNGGELFATPVGTSIAGILGSGMREKGVFYLEDNFDNTKRIGIPNNIFVIAETCDGNIVGFDLERTNLKDGVIVYWNHETNELDQEWSGFEEWLNDEMENGKLLTNYDGTDNDEIWQGLGL